MTSHSSEPDRPHDHEPQINWIEGKPHSRQFGDVYFSSDSGLEETRHVFIEGNQLITRWQAMDPASCEAFVIGETGFGTGLNFLLTRLLWIQYAPKSARLYFNSC